MRPILRVLFRSIASHRYVGRSPGFRPRAETDVDTTNPVLQG